MQSIFRRKTLQSPTHKETDETEEIIKSENDN